MVVKYKPVIHIEDEEAPGKPIHPCNAVRPLFVDKDHPATCKICLAIVRPAKKNTTIPPLDAMGISGETVLALQADVKTLKTKIEEVNGKLSAALSRSDGVAINLNAQLEKSNRKVSGLEAQLKRYDEKLLRLEALEALVNIPGKTQHPLYSLGFYDGRRYIVTTAETIIAGQFKATREELIISGKLPGWWLATLVKCLDDPVGMAKPESELKGRRWATPRVRDEAQETSEVDP